MPIRAPLIAVRIKPILRTLLKKGGVDAVSRCASFIRTILEVKKSRPIQAGYYGFGAAGIPEMSTSASAL